MKKRSVNMWAKLLIITLVVAVLTPVPTLAADDDARIRKLEAAINALQADIAALKAERAQPAKKQIDAMVSDAIREKKAEISGVPDWVSRTKIFGDFRYRHETVDNNAAASKRNRNRIRARVGIKTKINEEWDATVRLSTGGSGADDRTTSGNETLDGSFSRKEVWVDLAYADWHPEMCDGLTMYLGKMKNPFYRPGKNEIFWDSDVNPEGISAMYTYDMGDSTTAHVNAAGLWVEEEATDKDTSLFGVQYYIDHKLDSDSHIKAGANWYDYGNIDGAGGLTVSSKGNTIDGVGDYQYGFSIVEAFGEYGFHVDSMPVSLFGNLTQNTLAPSTRNTAYTIGVKLNKAKKPGSWQAYYNYRDVESDAVVGGISDSDFAGGVTNSRGHEVGFAYQLAKNVQTAVTYFDNEVGANDVNYKRFQVDLKFKF